MYVRPTSTRFSRGRSTPAIRAIRCLLCLALLLLVLRVLADDHHAVAALDHLAFLAHPSDRCPYLHDTAPVCRARRIPPHRPLEGDYRNRYVMRPRVGSYGDSSTFTRSPG